MVPYLVRSVMELNPRPAVQLLRDVLAWLLVNIRPLKTDNLKPRRLSGGGASFYGVLDSDEICSHFVP